MKITVWQINQGLSSTPLILRLLCIWVIPLNFSKGTNFWSKKRMSGIHSIFTAVYMDLTLASGQSETTVIRSALRLLIRACKPSKSWLHHDDHIDPASWPGQSAYPPRVVSDVPGCVDPCFSFDWGSAQYFLWHFALHFHQLSRK